MAHTADFIPEARPISPPLDRDAVGIAAFRFRISTLITLLAMSPLILAVLLGLKQYEVWSQITYLWHVKADPIIELGRAHPHALRYALLYPVLVASDHFGIDRDVLFTAILVLICFFTIRNIHATAAVLLKARHAAYLAQAFGATLIVLLFFMMNGRIGFAFLGYSMLLRVIFSHSIDRRFSFGSLLAALVGLALCSVSSGTLVSAALSLAIASYFEICRCIRLSRLTRTAFFIFLACLILGGLLFRYLVVGIFKNITFYGGGSDGILRMLEHGFGSTLYPALNAVGLPVVVLVVAVMAILVAALLFQLKHALLLHLLLAALACGAFGYSTLTLAAVPFVILVCVLLSKETPALRDMQLKAQAPVTARS